MSGYNGVIFDMDGTLLNTLEDIADSINHSMRKYGLPERSLYEVGRALGNGARCLTECLVEGGEDNPVFEKVYQEHCRYYPEHCRIKTRPYEGMTEVLRVLKEHNYKMAVTSNKGDSEVKELAACHFGGYMESAVGIREGIRKKPSPDASLEAVKLMGTTPDRVLYVGDTEVDYATAANAGVDCVLVSWGFRTKEELKGLNPKYLIDEPLQLLELLGLR